MIWHFHTCTTALYTKLYCEVLPNIEACYQLIQHKEFRYKLISFDTSNYKFAFHFQSHKLFSLLAGPARRFDYIISFLLCWCTQISYCFMSYSLLRGISIERVLLHKIFLGKCRHRNVIFETQRKCISSGEIKILQSHHSFCS